MRATGAMGRRGRGRGSEHRLHLPPLCSLRPDPWVTRPPQFPLQTSALPGSQLTAPRPCCPLTPFSPFPGFGGFPGRRRHSWTHFSDGDTEEQMRLLLNPRSCSNVGAPSAPTSYDPPSPSHSHLYNAPPAPPPCPRPWLPGRPHTHPPAVRNKLLSEDPCLKKKWSLDRLGPFKSLNRERRGTPAETDDGSGRGLCSAATPSSPLLGLGRPAACSPGPLRTQGRGGGTSHARGEGHGRASPSPSDPWAPRPGPACDRAFPRPMAAGAAGAQPPRPLCARGKARDPPPRLSCKWRAS